jgi:hypothetical protein
VRITIKPIWGILICSVVISGLSACSSSPSPWSQGDDSPWKAKRTAEAESVPSDEFINEAPMDDPVPITDPEPIVEAESEAWPYTPPPEPVEEPPVLAEPIIEPVAEPGSNEEWVRGLPATDRAVQLYAGRVMNNVTRYQETHALSDTTKAVKTDRDGDTIYVLVHIESDMAGAKQYAAEVEEKTGSTPWIRSVGGLQRIVP